MKTLWYKDRTKSVGRFLIKKKMKKAGTFGHTNPEVRKTVHLAMFSEHIIGN